MATLFTVCALLGGAILGLQFLLGLAGLDHHDAGDLGAHLEQGDGLNLLSVRALAAGLAFFGITGLAVGGAGAAAPLVVAAALAGGGVAMVAVAALMRLLLRLQEDGTVQIAGAVGAAASVYLRIPAGRAGAGKVTLTLQGRSVEYQAVSEYELPTGAAVVVVDVVGPDTVEVAPLPTLGGDVDAAL